MGQALEQEEPVKGPTEPLIQTGVNKWFLKETVRMRLTPILSNGLMVQHMPQLAPSFQACQSASAVLSICNTYKKQQLFYSLKTSGLVNRYTLRCQGALTPTLQDTSKLLLQIPAYRFPKASSEPALFQLGPKDVREQLIKDFYVIYSDLDFANEKALQVQALFEKGVVFIGLMDKNRTIIQGQILASTLRYRGRLVGGQPHGEGQQMFTKDNIKYTYRGKFDHGERDVGVVTNQAKKIVSYAGQFKQGLPWGHGLAYLPSSTQFGFFQKGQFCKGTVFYKQLQSIYVGQFRNGMRNGYGAYRAPNTSVWVGGLFVDNVLKERGKFLNQGV